MQNCVYSIIKLILVFQITTFYHIVEIKVKKQTRQIYSTSFAYSTLAKTPTTTTQYTLPETNEDKRINIGIPKLLITCVSTLWYLMIFKLTLFKTVIRKIVILRKNCIRNKHQHYQIF